jgi:hypothetical protein
MQQDVQVTRNRAVVGYVADNDEFRRQARRTLRANQRHELAELITCSMIQTVLRTPRVRRVKRVSLRPARRTIRVAPNKGDPSPESDDSSVRDVAVRGWSA